MKDIIISDDIIYIGADDKDIELFENQYNVPNGVAYNSYIIIDKKIAVALYNGAQELNAINKIFLYIDKLFLYILKRL